MQADKNVKVEDQLIDAKINRFRSERLKDKLYFFAL